VKTLVLDLPDKDYDLFVRIAKSQKRKPSDLVGLIFAEGIRFFFTEECIWFDKRDDEFTEEEKKQLKINKDLEKNIEGFWRDLDKKQREEKGYVHVQQHWTNQDYDSEKKENNDQLIQPLVERIENYVLEGYPEEVA